MSFFSFRQTNRPTRSPARRPAFRPRLEAFEDRCLLSAGVLDPTFNAGGSPPGTEVDTSGRSAAAVAVYPSNDTTGNANKVVVAGGQDYYISSGTWTTRMAVGRFNPDGAPDTTFNATGIRYVTFTNTTNGVGSGATAVAIQPDGKIVVAGNSTVKGVTSFAVVRFNVNGSLDTTFNKTGSVQTNVSGSGNNTASGMVLQPDGKIVVAGRAGYTASGYYQSAVVRYNPNGTLDSSWGNNGIEILTVGANNSWFNAVALENGQLVAAGQAVAPGASASSFDLVRFTATGQLDPGFGSGGIVLAPPQGTAGDGARALAVQADGKLVAAGDVDSTMTGIDASGNPYTYTVSSFALARYNTDGTPDTTFNGTGRVTLPRGSSQTNVFTAVLYQPADGKIVAAGYESSGGFAVARFNPNGAADATFGSGGPTTTAFGTLSVGTPQAQGAALQPDGRIVLVGGARQSGVLEGWSWALARYLPSAPQVGSFTASPNPVASGSSLTLTASNLTDGNAGSTVTQVTFYYYDSTGARKILGYGTQTSPGVWTLSLTVSLAPGSYTLYAQAQDSYGVLGDPIALALQVM